ncbi:MAG: hypothetical protein BWY17_02726 [Deltaproteobacteria bacterium ADurb.Bin207]|nr:MAG: hypothetical protein BWY17_02726 [Deltaproteobacteria bacterium ADurb.Bin207]
MPGVLAASAIEPRLHGLQVIVGCFDASQGVVGDAWRWIIERKSMMHVRTCGIQGALAKKRDRKRNMGGMMIAEPVQDSLAIFDAWFEKGSDSTVGFEPLGHQPGIVFIGIERCFQFLKIFGEVHIRVDPTTALQIAIIIRSGIDR